MYFYMVSIYGYQKFKKNYLTNKLLNKSVFVLKLEYPVAMTKYNMHIFNI